MDRELITDEGWPCQRLRLAFGSLFFFLFEITIGKQLPGVMSAMIFGLGVGSFASALGALRSFKLQSQLALIRDAIDQRSR